MAEEATLERDLADRFCRAGDEAAFRALYQAHTPRLYRVARRLLGAGDAATEDVIQESWIAAARSLASFRWESSLATWLTGIVINRCRQSRRQRERTTPLESAFDHGAAEGGELRLDLERALMELPPGYREVLMLHDVEGFTHEEIGRILGIEAGTSKSQLSHARRTLKARLGLAVGGRQA